MRMRTAVVVLAGVLVPAVAGAEEGLAPVDDEPVAAEPAPTDRSDPAAVGHTRRGHKGQFGLAAQIVTGSRFIKTWDDDDYCGDRGESSTGNATYCIARVPVTLDLTASYGLTPKIELLFEMRFGLERDFGATQNSGNGPRLRHYAPGARFYFDDRGVMKFFSTAQIALDATGYEDASGESRGIDVALRNANGILLDFHDAYGAYAFFGEEVEFKRWLEVGIELGVGIQAGILEAGVTAVIEATDLAKTYRTPFRRKKVDALRGVTFEVRRGEVFGFLGPNGAGKTTTIRCLMGLCSITGGRATILGQPVPSRAARQQLGFMPEHPYFYDYLTVSELLDLGGRLFGLTAAERSKRAKALIARVGLGHAVGQSLKKFSKGMLQRAGLALALINDPELVVLDEPMSGLDPVGRKEVRDLILELRDAGKTVFFSSHILSDVEQLSDRVAIIVGGKLQDVGRPRDLVGGTPRGTEVLLRLSDDDAAAKVAAETIAARAEKVRAEHGELFAVLAPGADVDDFLAFSRGHGARLISVTPRHETLEDLFLRRVEAQRS